VQTNHDALVDGCPGPDLNRKRQLQRRAIGLEGSVCPVPLVLHLEDLALHTHLGRQAGGNLVGDRSDPGERLMRRDEVRKHTADGRFVYSFDGAGLARARAARVQNTETDAVPQEAAAGLPVHLESNRAVRIPSDSALPHEIDLSRTALRSESDVERAAACLDLQALQKGRHGSPIAVAYGNIYAPDDLQLADADVVQRTRLALKQDGQRAGPQLDRTRTRPLAAIEKCLRGYHDSTRIVRRLNLLSWACRMLSISTARKMMPLVISG